MTSRENVAEKKDVEAEVKVEEKAKKERKPINKKKVAIIAGSVVAGVAVVGGIVYCVSRGKFKEAGTIAETAVETASTVATAVV